MPEIVFVLESDVSRPSIPEYKSKIKGGRTMSSIADHGINTKKGSKGWVKCAREEYERGKDNQGVV